MDSRAVSDQNLANSAPDQAGRPGFHFSWTDGARQRTIEAHFCPPETPPPWPVVIFSPGLGFTRFDYTYIKEALAAGGLAAAFLQHPGTDDTIWSGSKDRLKALMTAAMDPASITTRPPDASLALDELTRANEPGGPLAGRLDLSRIGAAGHSLGAMTALALAGAAVDIGRGEISYYSDSRIKAVAAMSSRAKRGTPGLAIDFSRIKIPVLHLTGTLDYSPTREITPADRLLAFQSISGVDQYLIVIKDGDHSAFLGRPERKKAHPEELRHHRLIARAITDFFRLKLLGDDEAGQRLADPARLQGLASLEIKKG